MGNNIMKNKLLALLASLTLAPLAHGQACVGDIVADGAIDGGDLGVLLAYWGAVTPTFWSQACDLDGNLLVNGADLGMLLANWGNCAPIIDSITPNFGVSSGSTSITISGTWLADTVAIFVGDTPVVDVVIKSPTTVLATIPPGTKGRKDVTVVTTGSTTTLVGGFSHVLVPAWAELLELTPNPGVVTNATLRQGILDACLAWRVRHVGSGIEMMAVPPGSFMMGASADDTWAGNEERPQHLVTLTKPFYVSRTEVTQEQWTHVMVSNPSQFQSGPNYPVEQLTWQLCGSFCSATGLRLPTEAEWEYSCRAGTTTPWYEGDWRTCGLCCQNQTGPVATLPANALGLYDTIGNVWEWVSDWYGPYSISPVIDPVGPTSGSDHMLRGGSAFYFSSIGRSSRRGVFGSGGVNFLGMRAVKDP
jgi:Sulfatase-modifying factor enzyme 1/IPT/TIG domain